MCGGVSDNAGVWWDHDGGRMGWRLGAGISLQRHHNPGPWTDRDRLKALSLAAAQGWQALVKAANEEEREWLTALAVGYRGRMVEALVGFRVEMGW